MTRHALEKACLEEAGHRFSQAGDTPLLQEPILKHFGEIGTNSLVFKQVLAGKFQPDPQTDQFIPNYFNKCAAHHRSAAGYCDHSKNTQQDGKKHGKPQYPHPQESTLAIIWQGLSI